MTSGVEGSAEHGTYGGAASLHKIDEPCAACRAARAEYMRNYRRRARAGDQHAVKAATARRHALVELSENHPAEYNTLNAVHRQIQFEGEVDPKHSEEKWWRGVEEPGAE